MAMKDGFIHSKLVLKYLIYLIQSLRMNRLAVVEMSPLPRWPMTSAGFTRPRLVATTRCSLFRY